MRRLNSARHVKQQGSQARAAQRVATLQGLRAAEDPPPPPASFLLSLRALASSY
jgi:hypothetical protein